MAGKRLSTNDVAIASALEAGFGEAPSAGTPWFAAEPNEIANFGGTITTVSRAPISPDRQQRKSVTTDFEAGVDITSDLTLAETERWASAFTLNRGEGIGEVELTGVASGGYTYKTGLAANEWDRNGAIIFGKGFAGSNNNGKHIISSGSKTQATISGRDSESTPTGSLFVVGWRAGSGALVIRNGNLAWANTNGAPKLVPSSGNTAQPAGWTDLGIGVGQWIYVGGSDSTNKFTTAAANGWFKVASINETDNALKLAGYSGTDDGSNKYIEVYFGQRWHNVPTNADDFAEQYFRFEAVYKQLGTNDVDAYEYINGCAPNAWTINMPLTEKVTSQTSFIAKDAPPIVEARLLGSQERALPKYNKAFNTSTDFAQLALNSSADSALSVYLKEVNFVITNNFAAEKVLATQGAAFMNLGTLEVTSSVQALFTDAAVVAAIRNNEAATLRAIIQNEDGACLFEIPSATLGGGGKDFTLNETVKINLDGSAFRDDAYGDSINVQVFHYLP